MGGMKMGGVTLNHKELFAFLRRQRLKHVRNAVFIKGKSGVGKSEAVYAETKDYAKAISNREILDWNAMTTEEREGLLDADGQLDKKHLWVDMRMADKQATDLLGMPDFTKSRFVEWKPRLLFAVLSDPRCEATLFFDEFNLASRQTQSASYQTILDRAVGDVTLSKGVFVVAAGNTLDDNRNIIETAPPLNNRFYHVTLSVPNADEWIKYNMDSEFPEPRIWGLLKAKEDLIHNYRANQTEEAFSTPRRLQFLSEDMKGLDETKKDDLKMIETMATSGCGEIFCKLFSAYLVSTRKINMDKILDDPASVKQYLTEPDLKYSIVTTLVYKCKNDKSIVPKALEVSTYFSEEDTVYFIRSLTEAMTYRILAPMLRKSEAWKIIGPRVEPILASWAEE
jgi:MoxR-like ATPase